MRPSPVAQRLARLALSVFVWFLFCVAVVSSANAATVRGRLDRLDGYGRHYPAPYITVTVSNQQTKRTAHTDVQGMYYIPNVPPGKYTLEIWRSRDPKQRPMVFSIVVYNRPYSDVAPIVVP